MAGGEGSADIVRCVKVDPVGPKDDLHDQDDVLVDGSDIESGLGGQPPKHHNDEWQVAACRSFVDASVRNGEHETASAVEQTPAIARDLP
ncbi:hypothetical protein [Salinispora arenicola]|uniref:hypothetical protein n=1 Tax=Salinispora arenicola TaxID=168697 RepID=UPI0016B08A4A|nr:hypothetical protein [Salinispora arenicola]NIL64867.1 hypothetical protein [Salinispora arenicola]